MPTYDYLCEDCEHSFDYFQAITSDPLTECPECKGKLKRLIGTGGALIFKGDGFFCTDYRTDKAKKDKDQADTADDSSS